MQTPKPLMSAAAIAALAFAIPTSLAAPAQTLAAAAPVTSSLASSDEKSDIKRGLKIFTEAADNTARLVMGKEYGAILGQHEQVLEAKQILDDNFTVDMKMKADAAVIKVVAASTTLKTMAADEDKDYRPVSMPMPTPMVLEPAPNSLWRPGARAFFKDQRAKQVGDVMTVVINIQNERAQLSQSTKRSRESGENASVTNFFGVSPIEAAEPHVGATGDSTFAGTGSVDRSENVNLRLAAVVLQVLPNGNLAVSGRQEVRVNGDLRELLVQGVIRPEDIKSDNTIAWDKIAEARISYGGRGTITDVQQPRYGQQIFDVVFPF